MITVDGKQAVNHSRLGRVLLLAVGLSLLAISPVAAEPTANRLVPARQSNYAYHTAKAVQEAQASQAAQESQNTSKESTIPPPPGTLSSPPTTAGPSEQTAGASPAEGQTLERLPPPTMVVVGPLPLEAIQQLAFQYNPSLAQASARVRAAQWNRLQVGLPPNPRVSYLATEMGNEGRSGQQGGMVAQEFVTAHKLRLNREVAQREVGILQQQWAVQRQRVLTDVTLAFYQVLVLQRRLQLVEGLLTTSTRAVETAQRLFDAAETRKTDLLQAQIEAQKAQLDLVRTRAQHNSAWRNLSMVVGMPGLPMRELIGNTDFADERLTWDAAVDRVLAGHPELGAALAAVDRASWDIRRARAQRMPNVDASIAVQHDNSTGDDIAQVQIELPLPLLNRNQGGIRSAQSDYTAARQNVEVVQLRLQQRLAEVYQQYESTHQQVQRYGEQILPLAQQALELISKGYEQGEVAYLDLLTAQRTYFQANLEYLDALGQLWMAVQQIDGLLLDDSLQRSP